MTGTNFTCHGRGHELHRIEIATAHGFRWQYYLALAILIGAGVVVNSAMGRENSALGADSETAKPSDIPLSAEELAKVVDAEEVEKGSVRNDKAGQSLDPIDLILKGGWLMLPIGLMSLIVVAFSFDRLIALRKRRIMPTRLVSELEMLGEQHEGFDPRQAFQICQKYPSTAANVVRAMLLRVGRPQSEVQHTVQEASEREAERLYANVRWLNLAAAISPLLGLLGTVWGMIQAFYTTTKLLPGQNKADFLAKGIYVALVTTLGGLLVAIPAAIMAHYFEGRIQAIFHQIDEMLFNLMPRIERFEGRTRVVHERFENELSHLFTPGQSDTDTDES